MTRRVSKSAAKRPARQTRPLPPTMEPEMPAYLRTLTLCAMAGTLRAPIGSSLAQIYLASARALIEAAISIEKQTREEDGLKARFADFHQNFWRPGQ